MKNHFFRTICIAALMLIVAAVASAQGHRGCTNKSLEGKWGYTESGTVIPPAAFGGATLAVAVGLYTFDGHGNVSAVQVSSAGGSVSDDTKLGTYTVDRDCTGTLTVDIVSSPSGLHRHSVWEFVLADDATEIRAVMRSTEIVSGLPPSVPVPVSLLPIMTMTGTRVSSDRDVWKN
jgi:hypothetical protein